MNEGCAENWTNCDGKYEKETKKAVEHLQENLQLKTDGKVGFDTLTALCGICDTPVTGQNGILCDQQCKCDQQGTDTPGGEDIIGIIDGDDWFIDIDIPTEYGNDCDRIKACLKYVIGLGDVDRWGMFVDCMRIKDNPGTKIPDWFNDDCMKWIPYDWEKGGVVICISGQGNSSGPYYSNGKGILVAPDDELFEYYKNLKMSETEARKLGIKGVDATIVASECCTKRRWKA